MSHNRNYDAYSLTYDQRLLLDLYINFYNHTSRQIDSLYDLQNDIRSKIDNIAGLSNRRSNQQSQTANYWNPSRSSPLQQPRQHSQTQQPQRPQSQQRPQQSHRSNQQRTRNNNAQQTAQINTEGSAYLIDFAYFNNHGLRHGQSNVNSFYENVPVVATRSQILASTRVVSFSQIENPLNTSCPVTLDRFQPESRVTQLISCGHIFTPSGIDSWLQTNVRCPVCRNDIRLSASHNEETKEEEHLEETKTDDTQEERRENIVPPTQSLSGITESLLESLFSPTVTSQMMDISQNSFFYDSSNNQIIFEGFLRRSRL
jgi:hypothetical protein